MDESALKQELSGILAGIAPEADLEDVEPDENFREALDIDSYDFLKLVSGIDEKLGVEIPEADYPQLDTLEGLLGYLQGRLAR